ncbi:MAG: acetate kinase [Candidatus Wallbacteria bacterium]|nr:acetate kinase [Candidatus Wallbacteria bacterium]
MKVLVLNCGSSSVKYQLLEMETEEVIAKGLIERVGKNDAIVNHSPKGYDKIKYVTALLDHRAAIEKMLCELTDSNHGVIHDKKEIDAVGHRLVHGAEKFAHSVLVTAEVIAKMEECIELAPLHNPPNITGVRIMDEQLPNTPQVGVFDTAFHQTMPDYAYLYGLPYELYRQHGVRRYGFHGTSHFYVAHEAAKKLGKPIESLKIITVHLGNGASITAIDGGKSVDTSMGLTPLEGLVMGTRCGDLDPAIPFFLGRKMNLGIKELDDLLNKKSGMLGLSMLSNDMREIEDKMLKEKDPQCTLAMKIYCYRIKKYIGSYAAAMGGLDAVVFTAGVGENSPVIREMVCDNMEFLGISIDAKVNDCRGYARISTPESRVAVFSIPTNEELVIARDTKKIVGSMQGSKETAAGA